MTHFEAIAKKTMSRPAMKAEIERRAKHEIAEVLAGRKTYIECLIDGAVGLVAARMVEAAVKLEGTKRITRRSLRKR